MVSYFFGWIPLVIVGAIGLLAAPWLGLIALLVVSLVALAALAFAFFFVPYLLVRAITNGWHSHHAPSPRTAMVLSARRQAPDYAPDVREPDAAPTGHALFIVPNRHGDGFNASIHGHMLELADPTDHRLAPSPDDLLVASLASDLAWSVRAFLRAYRLPEDVSVSAKWRTTEGLPSPADIDLTVTASRRAEGVSTALVAAFASSLAARSLAEPVVHISYEGVNP